MLPRRNRLTSTEFDRAFNKSQVVRHPLVQVRAHRRAEAGENAEVRAAFVVPKKQGKAHDRNRTKRRISERFRLHPRRNEKNLAGCDLIFLTTPTTHTASLQDLDAALDEVLRRLAKRMSDDVHQQKPEPVALPVSKTPQSLGNNHLLELTDNSSFQNIAPDNRPEPQNLDVAEEKSSADSEKQPLHFQKAPVSWLFIVLIRFYQNAISPSLPPSCRFFPTCSVYTVTAIERHGAFWGTLLGAWRICRCTPLCKGGFDPVPDHLNPRFCSPFLGLIPKNKNSKAG